MNPTLIPYFLPIGTGITTTSPLELLLWIVEQLNNAAAKNPEDIRGKMRIIAFSESIDELLDENGELVEENNQVYREKIEKGIGMLNYFAGDEVTFGQKWDDMSSFIYYTSGQMLSEDEMDYEYMSTGRVSGVR